MHLITQFMKTAINKVFSL